MVIAASIQWWTAHADMLQVLALNLWFHLEKVGLSATQEQNNAAVLQRQQLTEQIL